MSAQLSYAITQAIAYAGLLFDLQPYERISRAVETPAGAAFGIAVSRGTDADKQAVVGGTAFLGITIRALDREGAANTGAIKYSEFETAAIMREGVIWATCPTGCVPGDPVNYVTATGVLDSGAAVAGEQLINGAQWDSTASAGELGRIRLDGNPTLTAGV